MNNKKGFVYVATGKTFVEEAIKSVKSLKSKCSSIPAVLFTDKPNEKLGYDDFDRTIIIDSPKYNFIDKIAPLASSPFNKTIFIDTDTFIAEDVSSLFDILDDYDFLAAFAPGRGEYFSNDKIPDYFPEFNTGIIGYKESELCSTILKSWLNIYEAQIKSSSVPPHDQPAFRAAMFNSNAKVYCLPAEYNFRITNPNIVWSNATVKIIHGRHYDYTHLSKILNSEKRSIKLFYHDARFLSMNSIQFFNLKQNNSFLFKTGQFLFNLLHRIKFRLVKNKLPQKKKGN